MFTDTPVYNVNGDLVFGLRRESVLPDVTDVLYTVTQAVENKLWMISTAFYGIPDLWWVIASVNNINDPFVGIKAGTSVRIPSVTRLSNEGILTS